MTTPPSPNPLPTTEGVTQGWQDIATAPKDGSWFLCLRGERDIKSAHWYSSDKEKESTDV